MTLFRRFLLAPLILLMLLLAGGEGLAKPAVTGFRTGLHPDTTRVVLDLTGKVEYSIFTIADPYRVVIDLPDVEWRLPGTTVLVRGGLIERFRYGIFRPGNSRLVLDVNAPVVVRRSFMMKPNAQFIHRLVLDLAEVPAAEFRPQGQPMPMPVVAAIPTKPIDTVPDHGDKPLVVLDPGHGGVDPGTTGVSGVQEKVITLAAAKELKRQLEATGRYRVILTRTRDVFVELRERVEIARRSEADLFISLHADAIANPKFRGASVYTLSEEASDKEAAELAAKENKADVIAGVDLSSSEYGADVTTILIDLTQRETMNLSAEFATRLIPELGSAGKLLRKTHRFAGFRVLKAPDVPSVLVELGYVSNKHDDRLLRDPKRRAALMRAILRAIDIYFKDRESADRS